MPPRGHQTAEQAPTRRRLVEMHGLRIVFGGEGDDFRARDEPRSTLGDLPGAEIFPMQTRHGDPYGLRVIRSLDGACGAVNGDGAETFVRAIKPALTTEVGERSIGHRDAAVQCSCALIGGAPCVGRRKPMFDYRDLFQWERFITPSIIKIFYWLAVGISVLFGLSGIVSGLTLMALSPLGGLFWIIASLIGVVIGVIFARIISEFVLIMFRINEHLGAIRQRGQQM